ncbi:MAG: SIR2 family protein [Actinomycetota bacterium]|nr:SIR2 family protein [Actinomycetota bacterium]MDA8356100.1 SIR2 family protein [Actinomycetota bacterium]
MRSCEATHSEVVILGAGFSRAISAHLPLANELGEAAYDRAQSQAPNLFGSRPPFTDDYPFENWLSLLAEDQPHLDEAENRLNAARFAKLAQSIVEVLGERQALALFAPGPPWLYSLVSAFHQRKTTVVTLNYDTLLEVAVNSTYLGPPEIEGGLPRGFDDMGLGTAASKAPRVSPEDVIGSQPPLSALPRQAPEATMHLLKLHGSLGWWWVPNDASGATLAREAILSTFEHPVRLTDEQRRTLPGREPFIVPPLAAKSPYYRNPLTRQLWRDAFEAMRTADRISFVGYSLPRADLVMAGMIDTSLRGRETDIDVVDLDPDVIAERVFSLGGPEKDSDRLACFSGESAVEKFAGALCDETARDVPPSMTRLTGVVDQTRREMAVVTWSLGGSPVQHRVVAVGRDSDGTLRLTTDPWVNYGAQPSEQEPTTLDILRHAGGAERIVARTPQGQESVIVGYNAPNFDNPNARHVIYLIAAGQLPAQEAGTVAS